MNFEWMSILFVIFLLSLSLIIIKFIDSKVDINSELKRKSFHITMGMITLTFPYIFKSVYSVGMLGVFALVILFVLKNTRLKESLGTVLYSVNRESIR